MTPHRTQTANDELLQYVAHATSSKSAFQAVSGAWCDGVYKPGCQKGCLQVGFSNPFDVTKVDTREMLPPAIVEEGYCVAHTGRGRHIFIRELNHWYHDFELIEPDEVVEWRYRKSLLNDLHGGEAGTLSLVLNQRILHDFIYEDVVLHQG